MPRPTLGPEHIHSSIEQVVSDYHREVLDEVIAAVERDPIVVVGMAQNPYCRKARRYLRDAGHAFTYLEYGSYLSQWRARSSLKMWTGWPTFPMVFVGGTLVGGSGDLKQLIDDGALGDLLSGH